MATRIKVKRILGLLEKDLSANEIAKTYSISKHSIQAVRARASELGISSEKAKEQSDEELYQLFFPDRMSSQNIYLLPDYEYVHKELRKVGVTLKLLHDEYAEDCRRAGKIAVGYSKFCKDYGKFTGTRNFANHIIHKPGDRIEVDWSGPTMSYYDRKRHKNITVYLFVADLVYSRLAYVEPTLRMDQMSWMSCSINMWEFYGGVSRIIVCDNLKTGVITHPKEGEIVLNSEYEALASYYQTAVLPAAVKAPRQKNSTEGTVGDIATSIIAKLRNRRFYSFQELSEAVSQKLREHNEAPFEKRGGSRIEVFINEEKDCLRPLPAVRYEIGEWVYGRKVQLNSHVQFEKNFYSCPHEYIGRKVDLRVTPSSVSIYLDGERLKTHPRFSPGLSNRYRTDGSDLPNGSGFAEWTPERIMSWASSIGMATGIAITRILESRDYPEQSFNSALAVLRLSKTYSAKRLETACEMAIRTIYSPRYAHLKAILSSGQDELYATRSTVEAMEAKGCLRGADYYRSVIEKEVDDGSDR